MKKITLILLMAGITFCGTAQDKDKQSKREGLKKIEGFSQFSDHVDLSALSELSKLSELSSLSDFEDVVVIDLSDLDIDLDLDMDLDLDIELNEMFKSLEIYSDLSEFVNYDILHVESVDLENLGETIRESLKKIEKEENEK